MHAGSKVLSPVSFAFVSGRAIEDDRLRACRAASSRIWLVSSDDHRGDLDFSSLQQGGHLRSAGSGSPRVRGCERYARPRPRPHDGWLLQYRVPVRRTRRPPRRRLTPVGSALYLDPLSSCRTPARRRQQSLGRCRPQR